MINVFGRTFEQGVYFFITLLVFSIVISLFLWVIHRGAPKKWLLVFSWLLPPIFGGMFVGFLVFTKNLGYEQLVLFTQLCLLTYALLGVLAFVDWYLFFGPTKQPTSRFYMVWGTAPTAFTATLVSLALWFK